MIKRGQVATLVAEFLGTGFLTLLVLSVQRSTIGIPFFVAMIGALTTVVLVFIFGTVSGAILNPAIAIGLWTARKLATLTTVAYVAFELLGAWAAYYVYGYFINTKLTFVGGHFTGRTLAAEAVGAGVLGLVWGAVAYKKWGNNIKAPVVGIATMVGMVLASTAGIGLINPGLALGIRAWVWGTYVAGPVIGAVIGVNLFGLLFTTDKELATAKAEAIAWTTSSVSTVTKTKASTSKPATLKKNVSGKKTTSKKRSSK
jgi:glycerol uptake facilitator-like aquaporin